MLTNNKMFLRVATRLAAGALAAVVLAGVANATAITAANFNTWKTPTYQTGAPTGLNLYTIGSQNYNTAAGYSATPSGGGPSFTFVGRDNAGYYLAGNTYSKTLTGSANSGAAIDITFQNPQNAFLVSFQNSLNYTLTLSDGQIFNTSSKIFGFSLSHTVSSLSIASTLGTQVMINDFYFGTSSLTQDAAAPPPGTPGSPAATPEPATVFLLAGGSLVLAGCQRRWHKA